MTILTRDKNAQIETERMRHCYVLIIFNSKEKYNSTKHIDDKSLLTYVRSELSVNKF